MGRVVGVACATATGEGDSEEHEDMATWRGSFDRCGGVHTLCAVCCSCGATRKCGGISRVTSWLQAFAEESSDPSEVCNR